MTTYSSRVHACDICNRTDHAPVGELLPDGWAYSHAGVLHCAECIAAKKRTAA